MYTTCGIPFIFTVNSVHFHPVRLGTISSSKTINIPCDQNQRRLSFYRNCSLNKRRITLSLTKEVSGFISQFSFGSKQYQRGRPLATPSKGVSQGCDTLPKLFSTPVSRFLKQTLLKNQNAFFKSLFSFFQIFI